MNALVWRLHRNQVFFAAAAIVALTAVLLVTGINMAHDYQVALANCAATQSCGDLQGQLFRGDGAIIDLVNGTIVVPLLFGLFWGAPLVAKEFEDGTHNLAWTQGVTRRRWLSTSVRWALLAALVWGAAVSALVSWWRIPENALYSRFGSFDIQGIVPIAYSLCAVAMGIAVGSIVRRVLPALAVTLGLFVALRVVIGTFLRPHFLAPVARTFSLLGGGGPPANAWVISNSIVGPNGHAIGDGFSPRDIPAVCRLDAFGIPKGSINCLAAHGFRQMTTYQPDSRFWAFQGIEATIFVLLACAFIGVAFWRVLARDA
jgi:hypothetical protein